jgi:hypothetical protein
MVEWKPGLVHVNDLTIARHLGVVDDFTLPNPIYKATPLQPWLVCFGKTALKSWFTDKED